MNGLLAARWNVYPDRNRRRFYRVFVFKSKLAMQKFHEAQVPNYKNSDRVAAYCRWWDALVRVGGRMRRDKCCGNVCFYVGRCGAGIVAHEMTHAAHYALHAGNPPVVTFTKQKDERLAWTVGHLVGQFYRGYWKRFDGNGNPVKK